MLFIAIYSRDSLSRTRVSRTSVISKLFSSPNLFSLYKSFKNLGYLELFISNLFHPKIIKNLSVNVINKAISFNALTDARIQLVLLDNICNTI